MDSIITQVSKDDIPYADQNVDQSSKQNSLLRQRRTVNDKSSSSSVVSSVKDERGSGGGGGGAAPSSGSSERSASTFLRKLLNSCCCCVRKQTPRSKEDGKVCGETRGGGGREAWEGDGNNMFVGGGSGSVIAGSSAGVTGSSSSSCSNEEVDAISVGVGGISVGGESAKDRGIGSTGFLLPPCLAQDRSRPCMVIDLDETLVHSSFKPISNADFIVPVEIDGVVHQVYVAKRPYVDEFLQKMGELYECVLFTASLAKYADPVADLLDKWGVFRTRLFRDACVFHRGNYVKDLNKLGRSLHRVVIVDNSPASYIFHPDNAVPVASWFDDTSDTELLYLIPFFERLSSVDNVYTVLRNSNHPYNCINKDSSSTSQTPQSPTQSYSIIHNISSPVQSSGNGLGSASSSNNDVHGHHHEIIYSVSNTEQQS